MVELILVGADELRPLREDVLGSAEAWPGEEDDRAMHLAIKLKKATLAGAALTHQPLGDVGSEVWRLCGPVVRPDERRHGHGRRLVQAVQAVAEKRGGGLWARVPLADLPFYSALGFRAAADEGAGDDDLVLTWRPKP